MQEYVDKIKKKMTNDKENNLKIINKNKKKLFKINNYKFLVGENHISSETLLFLEAMFKAGFSPNQKDYNNQNIVLTLLSNPKDEKYFLEIVKLSIEYGLDVNYVDDNNNTLLHKIFHNMNYLGNIIPLYNLLKENGFNIFLVNDDWEDLINTSHGAYIKDYDEFIELYKKDIEKGLNEEFNDYYEKLLYEHGLKANSYNKYNLFEQLPNLYLNEKFLLKVIKKLLSDQNLTSMVGFKIILGFLNYGHSNEFIYDLIKIWVKRGCYINYQNDKGNTILHHIIKYDYSGNLYPIYILLIENGFDDSIKNNDDMTIYDLLRVNGFDVWDKEDILDCHNKINNDNKSINNLDLYNLNERDYNYLKIFVKDIEDNWVYRRVDHEYKFNNINLIIGSKGVGKTSYLINLCSRYNLRGEKALYITIDDILNNCEYINQFNTHLFKIMRICAENKIVLMIDDIGRIYKNDIKDFEKEEINMFIDMYVKQYGLYLIGTIDDEKIKLFTEDNILSNQINEENLCLPDEDELKDIINYMISVYNFKDDNIKELFVKLLVSLSNVFKKYDNISNIEIVKSIIDNLNNNEIIDIEQIKYSINLSKYFYKEILKIVNEELLELDYNNIDEKVKKLKKNI